MNRGPSRAAEVWLALFFALATRARWTLRLARPLAVRGAVLGSRAVREGTAANARRIFDRPVSRREARRFARAVVGNFYDFVVDAATSAGASPAALRARVARVEGHDAYRAARAAGRGAVLVTAHMGSFEVGLAALAGVEPRMHVVFKRDRFARFEAIRSALRSRLGVTEAPIDDGWATLMKLRDALRRDEVIVLQGDRAMPGQRAQRVPVLGGHLALPLGPVTLARLVGSPVVPVFTVRAGRDRFVIHLLDAIDVTACGEDVDGIDPSLRKIGAAIERFVAAHPTQWLVLEPAFAEDRPVPACHAPDRARTAGGQR